MKLHSTGARANDAEWARLAADFNKEADAAHRDALRFGELLLEARKQIPDDDEWAAYLKKLFPDDWDAKDVNERFAFRWYVDFAMNLVAESTFREKKGAI